MCLGGGAGMGGQRSSFSTWVLILPNNCREFLWREQQTGTLSSHVGFSQGLFTSFSAFPRGLFVQNIVKYKSTRWWFHYFNIFTATWGMIQFDDHIFWMGWKHPARSTPRALNIRKAGALHLQLWEPGGFAPRVRMAWMTSIEWRTPFRAGKTPCPRIGEGSCWKGRMWSWKDGWRWPKHNEIHVKIKCSPRK